MVSLKPLVIGLLMMWLGSAHADTHEPGLDPAITNGDRPESEDGPASESLDPEAEPALRGLLIDRTVTMIGKTFFQQFSQLRLDSPILSATSLTVYERPSARWGSIVWVTEGNRPLFQATLPPRLSEVDQYARAAVEQTEQLVLQRKVMQALQQS
ncbi:MAG: CsgE family curli-type amyloid fiber assembly protein, partial [Halomonas sp.]|nr:CsgE family curli-type amyloid fiber assembly protein [Halomonas sp.]